MNLEKAVATTQFTVKGVVYKREVFTSAPDQVMVIRLTASRPGQLGVGTRSQLRYQHVRQEINEFVLNGKAPKQVNPNYYSPKGQPPVVYEDSTGCNGLRFQLRLKAINQGGTVATDTAGVHVRKATEVMLLVTASFPTQKGVTYFVTGL